ncbi:transcription factor tfiia complex subunit [Diplodia corticola]|uniref:Transcription factor tfiia complex subunit n=1 Tax=Diplodia corticola TaxID=236234 RepID=A0A1J9QZA7_9PEZI|nr:transcription factor tfiia complex subunit [Diplodia corticola]OJD34422.1 transcription factor tfiia complex subunit [Diplodia corticola]
MSNSITGTTFAQIIDRVVQASQNDFEESGVDQQTLQEMKEIWQKKLSALHVAQMPWDPPPPQPQISNPPTVPSNDAAKPTMQQQMPPAASQPPNQQYGSQVRVKQEPGNGYENSMPGYNMNGYSLPNGNVAQQRAAALLQQNFGAQAQASIASAYPPQNNVGLPGHHQQQPPPPQQQQQQQRPMNLQMPPNRQQQAQQHPPPQQQGHPPNQPQQQQPNSVYAAQTDGAGDAEDQWRSLVNARRAEADEARLHADGILRAQFEQKMDVLESGLLQPIEELPALNGKKRRALATSGPSGTSSIPQLDGELGVEDEKEENDDEAINSDLDDSDEEQIQEGDDDGPQGDTMICTYDKVQRVKNKWKCTLKDGVLSTGGKDYLFHKAQGEFEW